ncbi:MAG: potassium transporter TrkG [Cytophagales bacterium]|nr:Trk-type K+ transporter membrane component [Bernardetiaceae bacterium]MDW8205896.1 potassium transporter TrkG [Cytophagales bacterium]
MAWSRLDSFFFQYSEQVNRLLQWFSYVTSLLTLVLLVYRYGFIHTQAEYEQIQPMYKLLLTMFLLVFLMRWFFSINRQDFLRQSRLEAMLYGTLMVHILVEQLIGLPPLLYYLLLFSLEPAHLIYEHLTGIFMVMLIVVDLARVSVILAEIQVKPGVIFMASFALLILAGTGLLMLPAMTVEGHISFLDALFTAASASCVTGLIVVDTATFFTLKGKVVIMLLFQLGGLGVVLFATFFATFMGGGVGIKQQSMIQNHLSAETLTEAKAALRKIVWITLIIELLGTIAIYYAWDDERWINAESPFANNSERIFYSAFHAISAFCNAGFSLFTDGYYNHHYHIYEMYGLHFVTTIIIVFGGMGFNVIEDIFSPANIRERLTKPWKKLQLSTKIPLIGTLILLIGGTIAFMILEYEQLRVLNIGQAFITALFQSAVTRTAGFNSIDFGSLQNPTIIVCIFLMFVGTAPGSTGGGIKINTFAVVVLSAIRNIRGEKKIVIEQRYIPNELVNRAFTLLLFAFTYNSLAVLLLTVTEPDKPIHALVFEQISAFATVGLSMNLTSSLSVGGKIIIIISMFIGRVGPLTLAIALSGTPRTNLLKYPRTYLMIG